MIKKPVSTLIMATFLLSACQSAPPTADAYSPLTHASANHRVTSPPSSLSNAMFEDFKVNHPDLTLDDDDLAAAGRAEQRGYLSPIGQPVTWNNPDNNHRGSLVPLRDGYAASGIYCREFQENITIEEIQQQSYGKACQQTDGTWKIFQ